ncbi:MAG: hypothetical protein KatS3mg096_892 [Candidatus Parcubacteria bacterium]|nr:MAG: hypothetical protein KatS3mg096_892 [Candidatus Parcubacteria bacterium]
MKLAIMQPYLFPYIGYFQLVNTVNKFIFYDDVNFIKNGWINRNRILIQGKAHYITIQLKNASSFKPICEIEFNDNTKQIIKSIYYNYKRAPFFHEVFKIIEGALIAKTNKISELAINSIKSVCEYLKIETQFEISSIYYHESINLTKENRIIKICKKNNADTYINPIGGIELYNKDDFKKQGIELKFLKTKDIIYKQFDNEFVPNLSIIDVMMFNSKDEIKKMLNEYELL